MEGKRVDFRYLSERDMIEAGVLDVEGCVDVMEETFRLLGEGDYLMGGPLGNEHGHMLWFPEEKLGPNMPVKGPDRRFMAMIAYLGGRFNVIGEKWYGSNTTNPQRGLPRSILNVILNDPDTSEPLAFMSANLLSAMRTGAVPGVATKYLARSDAGVIGVIGGGVINKACLMAIAKEMNQVDKVVICDINMDKARDFAGEMSERLGCEVVPTTKVKGAVVEADVISVATSGPQKARIETEWLKEGTVVTLTGPADMDDEVFVDNPIVADNWKMHQAWRTEAEEHPKGVESITEWAPTGQLIKLTVDGAVDEDRIMNLGDIVKGDVNGRKEASDKIIFVTGGMPVEDVAWAYELLQRAEEKGIGQVLNLWEEPYWF